MSAKPLGIGIVGLGRAAAQLLPSLVAHPGIRIVAGADRDAAARERFSADYAAATYADVRALCADPAVAAVYVATPHAAHAADTIAAVRAGKHVLVEKPMALNVTDAEAMTSAAARAGVALVVGPTHGGDPPIAAIGRLVRGGAYGRLRAIVNVVYGDFLYRPRRPAELDTAQGGGILFNQVPHMIEIAREIDGGAVRSVRAVAGRWDPDRPTEGALSAFITFAGGAVAQLSYSGYDRFDSDELTGWVAEFGETKAAPRHGKTQRALVALGGGDAEARAKAASGFAGRGALRRPAAPVAHPHFGFVLVSCERADMRPSPGGVLVYDADGVREHPVPLGRAYPDKDAAVDELYAAAIDGVPPRHDGAWGATTVALTAAIVASAREDREIVLDGAPAIAR